MLTTFAINTLLIFMRLAPVLVVSPVAVFARVPLTVRVFLGLIFAAVMASSLPDTPIRLSPAMLAGELVLGMVIAFGFHVAKGALDMLGRLLDTQVGLNASGVFDPGTQNVTGIIAELLGLAFLMLFVATNQHHELLRALNDLLALVPPGSVSLEIVSAPLLQVMAQQFLLALIIVAPVVVALWLTDVAFAFMSRSMPQANVYFLALPIKLALGALMLLLTLPLIVQRVPLMFEQAVRHAAFPLGMP